MTRVKFGMMKTIIFITDRMKFYLYSTLQREFLQNMVPADVHSNLLLFSDFRVNERGKSLLYFGRFKLSIRIDDIFSRWKLPFCFVKTGDKKGVLWQLVILKIKIPGGMCSVVEHATCKLLYLELFLDEFAKFRIATISFVMSVLQSVFTHGKTRLPLDGFSWNLTFVYLPKLCL